MDNKTPRKKIWCANALVGAPWACGYDHSKENFEHDISSWCANALVGAPWACGYDHSKENHKHKQKIQTY